MFLPDSAAVREFCGQPPEWNFQECWKIDCRVNLIVCHDRSPPGGEYQAIKHKRRRLNVIFGNGRRKLRFERK
jgi:hypothetical protein